MSNTDPVPPARPARATLRATAVVCLLLWAGIWVIFLALRFSKMNFGAVRLAGPLLLLALVSALLLPVVATLLAAAAVIRRPGAWLNWLILGGALAVLGGQAVVFMANQFM